MKINLRMLWHIFLYYFTLVGMYLSKVWECTWVLGHSSKSFLVSCLSRTQSQCPDIYIIHRLEHLTLFLVQLDFLEIMHETLIIFTNNGILQMFKTFNIHQLYKIIIPFHNSQVVVTIHLNKQFNFFNNFFNQNHKISMFPSGW